MLSRVLPLVFTVVSLLFADQDHWKGDEYAKNSGSQKSSAEILLKNSLPRERDSPTAKGRQVPRPQPNR